MIFDACDCGSPQPRAADGDPSRSRYGAVTSEVRSQRNIDARGITYGSHRNSRALPSDDEPKVNGIV